MREIIQEVNEFLSKTVAPLEGRSLFHARPSQAALSDVPMVLMLGNHSSGKSSFINYFIQHEAQETGMAPTDEDFTILRFGPQEKERPGNSVVSNSEFGYEGLSSFGPRFLSHLRMRMLPLQRLQKISLVDTPGMIDSADSQADRGYDFRGAVRWFAERADLILLFFDPERPGTTAETLQVYTEGLADYDHKLLVVMNKVDQFRKLPDLARCYGTLCWNLGKVMRTKDLPQIYISYIPTEGAPPSPLPMLDFDRSRERLITKVEHTSLQRADNLLTEVTTYLERLLLHARAIDFARRWYVGARRRLYGLTLVGGLLGAAAGYWIEPTRDALQLSFFAGGGLLIAGIIAKLALQLMSGTKQRRFARAPDLIFDQIAQEDRIKSEHYEHLKSHWRQISTHTMRAINELSLGRLPKLKRREAVQIQSWLRETMPKLRARVHLAEDDALQQNPVTARSIVASSTKKKSAQAPSAPAATPAPVAATPAPVAAPVMVTAPKMIPPSLQPASLPGAVLGRRAASEDPSRSNT